MPDLSSAALSPRLRRPSPFLPLLASLLLPACAADGSFDPTGDEVALYGEWDVNCENPAVVDTCAEAGIAEVELVFFPPLAEEAYTDSSFRFPCEDGVMESGEGVLRAGTFAYEWRAYLPNEPEPIATSERFILEGMSGGEVVLTPVNFLRNAPQACVDAVAAKRGGAFEGRSPIAVWADE